MSEEKVCQLIFDHEPSICCHSSQVMGLTCPCAGAQVATTSPLLVYLDSRSALRMNVLVVQLTLVIKALVV